MLLRMPLPALPLPLPCCLRATEVPTPTDRLAMVLNRPETDRHCGGVIGRTVVFTPSLYTGCSIKAYHISYFKTLWPRWTSNKACSPEIDSCVTLSTFSPAAAVAAADFGGGHLLGRGRVRGAGEQLGSNNTFSFSCTVAPAIGCYNRLWQCRDSALLILSHKG